MKSKAFLARTSLLVILCACSKSEQVDIIERSNCIQTGFTAERVCAISHFQALGSDTYVNKVVRISGYIAEVNVGGDKSRLLFFSKEQAEMQNVSGAVGIGEFSYRVKPSRLPAFEAIVQSSEARPVELVGTLTINPSRGLAQPALTLADLVGARESITANELSSIEGN